MAATKTKNANKNTKAQTPAKARKAKAEFPRIAEALEAPLPETLPTKAAKVKVTIEIQRGEICERFLNACRSAKVNKERIGERGRISIYTITGPKDAVESLRAEFAPDATPVATTEQIPQLINTVGEEQTPAPKAETAPKPAKKMSALDAAAQVLRDAGGTMNCKGMIEAMAAAGLWTSPGGKTPAATLYAAILREITVKGDEARFKKADRGQFTRTAAV